MSMQEKVERLRDEGMSVVLTSRGGSTCHSQSGFRHLRDIHHLIYTYIHMYLTLPSLIIITDEE